MKKKTVRIAVLCSLLVVLIISIVHFSLSLHQPLYYINENMVKSISIHKYKRSEEIFLEIPKEDISKLISAIKNARVEERTKEKHYPSSKQVIYKIKFKSGITFTVKCVGKYCFAVNNKLWRIDKSCDSFEVLKSYEESFKA